jgi:hypothetical protein
MEYVLLIILVGNVGSNDPSAMGVEHRVQQSGGVQGRSHRVHRELHEPAGTRPSLSVRQVRHPTLRAAIASCLRAPPCSGNLGRAGYEDMRDQYAVSAEPHEADAGGVGEGEAAPVATRVLYVRIAPGNNQLVPWACGHHAANTGERRRMSVWLSCPCCGGSCIQPSFICHLHYVCAIWEARGQDATYGPM